MKNANPVYVVCSYVISWRMLQLIVVLVSVKCSYGNFVKLQCDSQVLITTAADDTFCDIFPNFRKKIRYDIS